MLLSVVILGSQHTHASFQSCLTNLQGQAKEAGISNSSVALLAKLDHVDRVIELDRRQPEFTQTFATYLNKRVNKQRVDKGRKLLETHATLLKEVSQKYGVPAQYLVAFWGLETNFGGYLGKMPTLDSLATLACDERRSAFFTQELINALKIIDEGAVQPGQFRGSWAGAVGHMQFMPSAFLRYAVDGDGDGKRDLWRSIPDALHSAGYFLSELGWQRELRWGREVLLPKDFAYVNAGLDKPRPLSAWKKMGIIDVFQRPLAELDIEASLLVPSGYQGPAFLVYDNFKVIMRWNRSEFYALAVGHMADRIAGAGRLKRPPPTDTPRLARTTILSLQETLNRLGYNTGEPDGVMGPRTRNAIRQYQSDRKMIADGFPSLSVFNALNISVETVR